MVRISEGGMTSKQCDSRVGLFLSNTTPTIYSLAEIHIGMTRNDFLSNLTVEAMF